MGEAVRRHRQRAEQTVSVKSEVTLLVPRFVSWRCLNRPAKLTLPLGSHASAVMGHGEWAMGHGA
ncbi:MAG: hypothetical protein ICV78_18830 [Tolypothrix sp. Co-bin9]|nr:hypothetical protein [Tolypothrix sp. Co-bin9]